MKKIILLLVFFFLAFNSVNALTETIILTDNFNDGSIADWDVNAGTWSAASFFLSGGGLDGSALSHTATMPAGMTYNIYFKLKLVATATAHTIWFTNQTSANPGNPASDLNGYDIVFNAGSGSLNSVTGGSPTALLNVGAITTGVYHDINITHTFDGNIQVWIDGVAKGSVINTTYTTGTRFTLGTTSDATNNNWDDLNIISTGDTNTLFRIVDEVSVAPIAANLTINGNPWFVQTDGTFDVNSGITFPATFLVSLTGYDTRSFTFDTNQGLHEVRRLGLRVENQANDISFQFFAPDEITTLPNRMVKVSRNNVLSGRAKTDAGGFVTFNLAPQDSVYDFNIMAAGSDFGDANNQYKYDTINIIILRPKDESTDLNISGGFDFEIGGLGLQSVNNQTTFPYTGVNILGNTLKNYTLRVQDTNFAAQIYFSRYYSLWANGDVSSITIQPYLIKESDGSVVKFTLINKIDNTTVPDKLLTINRIIGSNRVTVEQKVSDASGSAGFIFLPQIDYNMIVTDLNGFHVYFPDAGKTGIFTDLYSGYNIKIILDQILTDYNATDVNVLFNPNTETLTNTSQRIDVNAQTDYATQITIRYYDGNSLLTTTTAVNQDLNDFQVIDFSTFTSDFFKIEVTITGDGVFTQKFIKVYFITENPINLLNDFRSLGNNAGLVVAMIITVLVIFLGLQFLGPNPYGNDSQVFFVGLILALSGFIFFLPDHALPIIFALFAGILVWMVLKGV